MPIPRKTLGLIVAVVLSCSLVVTFPPEPAGAASAGLLNKSILTKHVGNITVTQANTVIENMEIHGRLDVRAPNVTIRNVWIYTTDFWTIFVDARQNPQVSLTIEHSEIGHPNYIGQRGIGGDNITARYLDIHHVEDGVKLGENVLYDGIRVHNLASLSGSPHADAIQDDGGARNAIVRNSHLDAKSPHLSGNASVIIKADLGSSRDILFENNYLNGGGWMVYVRKGNCCPMPQNVTFRNNRIGPDFAYGVLSVDGPITWTGNVWASNGQPVDVGGGAKSPPPTTTPKTTPTTKPSPKPATTQPSKPPTTSTTSTSTTSTTTTTTTPSTTTTQPTTTTTDESMLGSSGGLPPVDGPQIHDGWVESPARVAARSPNVAVAQTDKALPVLVSLAGLVFACYIYTRRSRLTE